MRFFFALFLVSIPFLPRVVIVVVRMASLELGRLEAIVDRDSILLRKTALLKILSVGFCEPVGKCQGRT